MWARILRAAIVAAAFSTLAACASLGGGREAPLKPPVVTDPAPIVSGTMRPYQIRGRWYHPKEQPNYDEVGQASWYGSYHHGRSTSTGERFDMNGLTAAHKTLPLPSLVEVTNRANGRRVILRVNDRGPFVDGRIIDLSRGAVDDVRSEEQELQEPMRGTARAQAVAPRGRPPHTPYPPAATADGAAAAFRLRLDPDAPTPRRRTPTPATSRSASPTNPPGTPDIARASIRNSTTAPGRPL